MTGAKTWIDKEKYVPSYNVAPGHTIPVVVRDDQHAGPMPSSCGDQEGGLGPGIALQSMRWGLIPAFTKPQDKPNHWKIFNCRSETVGEKPVFKRLVEKKRCLVITEGFYEWSSSGSKVGGKQPYFIHFEHPDGSTKPMVMAGLYDCWKDDQGNSLTTCTILTIDSCPSLSWLHDRMPVILGNEEAQCAWLRQPIQLARKYARPYDGKQSLAWYPVTQKMSQISFQGQECSMKLKKVSIGDFFRKPEKRKALFKNEHDGESLPVKEDEDFEEKNKTYLQ